MIDETELLNLAVTNIRTVLEYNPYKSYKGIKNRQEFQQLIAGDPAFGVLGLDDERYIIARVGGNLITSLHRKIGDMYEALFRYLLKERFELTEEDLNFSVEVKIGDRIQMRSTDGLIKKDKFNQNIPQEWSQYEGIGFEIRSCYQIGDSKRIQADYDMSLKLKEQNILPVMIVFCNTSLKSPLARLSKSWNLYQGEESFNIVHSITRFDLYDFLQRNSDVIKQEINNIFLANF
ncbi:type I restriction endonuclease [Crocosphaera sp. XPORK-15E]|uniref:type I restriction endonuclease n=1 Tax=Crocosphaera sp. XPORK-15E TaxID=3110247 RepID=UPI002B20FF9D|nr:type I restriction endonuclease [Crocosphaera sp. XPORK-15E]MEA5533148.1 type I restriction endonuclease [Crocosphaera sp. XPORK-15E]